jgi:hypothetical protein
VILLRPLADLKIEMAVDFADFEKFFTKKSTWYTFPGISMSEFQNIQDGGSSILGFASEGLRPTQR